jgi:trigger factor
MKKKLLVLMVAAAMTVSLTACSDKKTASDTVAATTLQSQNTTTAASDSASAGDYVNPQGSVVLGNYKGVSATKEVPEVTDDEVQEQLDSFVQGLSSYEDVTDHSVVTDTDVVNIDYTGKIDGKEFDGGSDTGYDLDIANSSFIDGFAEGIVGMSVGDTKDLDLTFPDDYSNADCAGKAVVFTVTVNKIEKSVTPELTDKLVADNTDYDTIDAYKESIKSDLLSDKEDKAQSNWETAIFQAIIDSSTFTDLSTDDSDAYATELEKYYQNYADMYGIELDQFLQYFVGEDYDTFLSEAKTQGDFVVKQNLILKAVISAEGITISDDEYSSGCDQYASDYGYDTTEAFVEAAGEDSIRQSLLYDKAYNFIIDNAVAE